MDILEEYYRRNPDARTYLDPELQVLRDLSEQFSARNTELLQVMNRVADKYTQWSLAKDQFKKEVIDFSSEITSNINTNQLSLRHAITLLEKEIDALKKQDEMMTRKAVRQIVIVKPRLNKEESSAYQKHIDLGIAGVGFVTGGLQVVSGIAMASSGIGLVPGALLIGHGLNNMFENGYYLLFRESCTGPLRFVYQGVGEFFGLSAKEANIIYTFVDLGLSANSLLSYRLTEEATRLYRYINADLLWGMKEMGIKLMSKNELIAELIGDANTVLGHVRSN